MAYSFRHGDRPLEGFTIQRGIGRGGFGEVYYAMSDGGREVALKYLRDNAEIELRGVSHCMNLKSPHLVTIFDVVKNADGEFFIIMEHVSGPSLADLLIAEPKGLGIEKAAFFLREIAAGLGYLHDRGVVHRDLKPANIFYEEGHVKIGDYGLSKFISVSRHSVQTASVGTVHYMAPEVGSGNYHRGIDIYALGVILYEMLLGKVPFEGSSMGEILMKHLTEQPEVANLPDPFGGVIRKALAKDPQDRYQSVYAMMDDVLEVGAVRESLAGFNPSTIAPVPRQPADALASPVLSPNPIRPPPPPPPMAQPVHPAHRPRVDLTGAFRDFGQAVGHAARGAAHGPGQSDLVAEVASGQVYYAGFWVRLVAVMIDAFLIGFVCKAVFHLDNATAFVLLVYQALMIALWNGQTLGKRACGIRIISTDGRPVSMMQSFGRAFAKILNIIPTFGVGYLMVGFDRRKRGLHDRLANTVAVFALEPEHVVRRAA